MKLKKIKCSKCHKSVEDGLEVCMNCGAVVVKTSMLTKKQLNKMKEI